MTNCRGCGILLQCNNSSEKGYIRKDKINEAAYCENCFKMIHYGKSNKTKEDLDITNMIRDISAGGAPIIFIVDVLNITEGLIKYLKKFPNNKKYILINKIDLLPKSVKERKLIKYFKDNYFSNAEVMCISTTKNHNIKKIYKLLKDNNERKVYVIGGTNAGKSSFINSIMALNNIKPYLTTSPIPNTTETYLNIDIDGLQFIDTPGINEKSIINHLSDDIVFKIKPKKELKVKTFQMKSGYSITINDLIRIDYLEGHTNSLNFYMNEILEYKKFKTNNNKNLITLPNKTIEVSGKCDIVFNGLGFIKINKMGIFKIYTLDEELIKIRKNMI